MIKDAVKKGAISGANMAMMEDRMLISQARLQVYGTQIFHDSTGYDVNPIEHVENVDKRRIEAGHPLLAEYLQKWHIVWSVEQYKKDLPNSPAAKRLKEHADWLKSQK